MGEALEAPYFLKVVWISVLMQKIHSDVHPEEHLYDLVEYDLRDVSRLVKRNAIESRI